MGTPLITCKDVELSYEGVTAAKNINIEIDEGDYYSIVGENGSGKSTLLRALLKLKQPSGGSIEYSRELNQSGI